MSLRSTPHPIGVPPQRGVLHPNDGFRAAARSRGESLAVALAITVAASAVPDWWLVVELWRDHPSLRAIPWKVVRKVILLLFGLALVLPTRKRSGLCIGDIKTHWRSVMLVCGLPPLVAALVYPNLPVRPYSNAYATMWLVSPFAQSLVFVGFLYGYLESSFSNYVHPRLPVRWALVLTMLLFGLWHAPNFANGSAGYVWFQLFYTGILGIIPALSRQWTGSMLYVAMCHTAVNFVAWVSG